jgi:hypothetical protein
MEIDPPDDAPINDIELSGDECIVLEFDPSAYSKESKEGGELDPSSLSSVLMRKKSFKTFVTILAAKAQIVLDCQTGTSFDSIQALVSLEGSVTHHLDEISLTAEQQITNRKVLSSEFLNVFTHYIDELYSTGECDVKLNISKNENQSSRLQSSS